MRKLLYLAVGLFVLAAIGGGGADGSNPPKPEAKKATSRCVVDREKISKKKEGMSIFQIERDVGCAGTVLSSSTLGNFNTVMVTWQGSGSFGANMNATFQ